MYANATNERDNKTTKGKITIHENGNDNERQTNLNNTTEKF